MIRPVELQDALSKTQAVEKISQSQKANPENEQRNAIAAEAKRTQDTQRRTLAPTHSDEVILHRDRQNDKKNKKDKASGEDAEQNEETEPTPDDRDTSQDDETPPPVLDIKV